MECPKCQSEFEKIVYGDIEVDRCTGCKGLWFDMLGKEDLVQIAGSEVIDVGSDVIGEAYDSKRSIKCPVCHQEMIPMVDKDQFHIHYESCATCFGTFFDAGEFRDLKERTVLERFTQMLQTIRSHF